MGESTALKSVTIYTDGACSGNPGPGGWAAVLRYGEHCKEISGFMAGTTNNRMEIFAAIEGLAALKQSCDVTVCSDSAYLVNAFEKGWIDNWKKNGWKNAAKQPVENQDLWTILLMTIQKRRHTVHFVKVPGHADNTDNNRCDELAKAAIREHMERMREAPQEEALDEETRKELEALEKEFDELERGEAEN